MKKILFSLCALAAIAACTKSEVQYEPSGEISFAPVAKTLSKSVAGYKDDGTAFDGIFPTGVNLYVFANASNDDGDAWKDPYFANALFKWDSAKSKEDVQGTVATEGAYAGDPTRYWPNVKTLKFIGYSAACNVAATDGTATTAKVDDDFTTLTISDYTQDNTKTEEGANDLMWFPTTQEYGKRANEIAVQMKHACSWITINVAKHSSLNNIEYKLNKLELDEFNHSGEVVCATTGATWAKNKLGNPETEVYCEVTRDNEITTDHKNFETAKNNFIVIPQTPVDLNVTYTYTSDDLGTSDTSDDLKLQETASVSLALANNADWVAGIHYIYNVTITATEILIDPVVVDWTTGTTPAVTLPENN
jgi:hypothetical protein